MISCKICHTEIPDGPNSYCSNCQPVEGKGSGTRDGKVFRRRTDIEIERECDEILRLLIAGATPKQIQELRHLPPRTYLEYYNRVQDRIIGEQLNKRSKEILVDKQIVKERLTKSLQVEYTLMSDEHISSRTRMDAGSRYSEIAVALFRLEIEGIGILQALDTLRVQKPIQLPPPDRARLEEIQKAVEETVEEEEEANEPRSGESLSEEDSSELSADEE